MDSTMLGETAAKLMDRIETETEGHSDECGIVAVGIVVVIAEEDATDIKVQCSDDYAYRQVGLFHGALELVRAVHPYDDGGDDDV